MAATVASFGNNQEDGNINKQLAIRIKSHENLIFDLWWFIENVTDEDPSRTDRFFALRERIRALQTGPNTFKPTSPWMSLEDARLVEVGDKLEMLVSGCGESDVTGETVYFEPGETVEVISIDDLFLQGLFIGVQTNNGVVIFFDELDYNQQYPFKRIA